MPARRHAPELRPGHRVEANLARVLGDGEAPLPLCDVVLQQHAQRVVHTVRRAERASIVSWTAAATAAAAVVTAVAVTAWAIAG